MILGETIKDRFTICDNESDKGSSINDIIAKKERITDFVTAILKFKDIVLKKGQKLRDVIYE
jgi:hypothetical protein